MTKPKIFYLLPDFIGHRSIKDKFKQLLVGVNSIVQPIGGVKIIYQHVYFLREHGFEAYVVMSDCVYPWFSEILPKAAHAMDLSKAKPGDIVVFPEVIWDKASSPEFSDFNKILFVQNNMKFLTDHENKIEVELSRFDSVFCVSNFLADFMKKNFGIEAFVIPNGIDLNKFLFSSTERLHGSLLCLRRKRPEEVASLIHFIKSRSFSGSVQLPGSCSESEMIIHLQRADIYFHSGYPEGFALPPLEAMACGAVIVGYTGGGGNDFMYHNKNCIVVQDGNWKGAAEKILELLNNHDKKETLRRNGRTTARNYDISRMATSVVNYFNSILDENKK